ncbi:MAG: phenylalanine--tRNA ligase subunit beta [Ignavibacteriales bacterium]|nr:phenylalanine--tRNA ligase subunit beta [Ignavibacteriales bacterium]
MRISLEWLKKYVAIKLSPEELGHLLTMRGLEVESIEYQGEKYNHFVVAKVLEVQKHPKADRLTVCQVDTGSAILQIVCGAPNVAAGQIVAAGLIDAVVPRNQHDPEGKPFKISKASLRGIESHGMICSEYELGLGEDKDGILILDDSAPLGTPLAEYLGVKDTILEIGVTPNRPDALSHIGIAREVAAIQDIDFKLPKISIEEEGKSISDFAKVIVEDIENCPRYSGRLIKDVKVARSPLWLEQILESVGIRPVNNIVDVTNYVLMECGQPLHAFDFNKVENATIIVKSGLENYQFTTLDHKERKLRSDTLMICDGKKPIAVAGVMGGENTEITQSTKCVFIESAYFLPRSIRRTSKYFGLSSDASQRFERGADPNITLWAVDRAAEMIKSISGGTIIRKRIDVYPKKIKENKITLRVSKVNQLLGITLSNKEIIDLLEKIFFKHVAEKTKSKNHDLIKFLVPTFRPDIERGIDVIEEIARMYGYDNIPINEISKLRLSEKTPPMDFLPIIRNYFVGAGFQEIITNSMQPILTAQIGSDRVVKIANPISRDMEALRTSLLPSVVEVIRENIFKGNSSLRLFEIGKTYFCHDSIVGEYLPKYTEKRQLLISSIGDQNPLRWDEKSKNTDFFDMKGEIESFFKKIFLDNIKFIQYPNTDALSERGVHIEINKECIGKIGYVHKELLKQFGIENEIVFAEIEIEKVIDKINVERHYKALPKYPSIIRDIALVIDSNIPMDRIEECIKSSGSSLLKGIELFDTYFGKQVGDSKKSYAFRLEFYSEENTLTQIEIDDIMNSIINQLENKFKAIIRR